MFRDLVPTSQIVLIARLKQVVAKRLMINVVMLVNDSNQIISDRMEPCMTRNSVLLVIVFAGSWNVGPVEATVTSMSTALGPKEFCDKMRERVT